ncbi:hypothetical protein JCM3774_006723 [Rhodotorula dairenensis]
MTSYRQPPVASTSRLPLHAFDRQSETTGSNPSPSLSSILKPPTDRTTTTTTVRELSRPYYFYHHGKRVKARIDREVPLDEVVKQLVRSSQLALDARAAADPDAYALRERATGRLVSDENLAEMLQTATYFDLVKSPTYEADQVVRKLRSADPAALKHATFALRTQLTDAAFRRAFIAAEGVPALQAIVRRGSGNTLAYALTSLHVLLDAGGLAFDSLFVARLVDIVALEALVNVTRPATAVLCALAANARKETPDRDTAYSNFVDHLLRQKLLLPALVERLSTGDLELSDVTVDLLDQLLVGSVETSDARIPDRLEATDAWRTVAKTVETNVGVPGTRFSSLQSSLKTYLQAASSTPITEDDYHLFDEIWVASQLKDVDEANRWRRLGFRTEAPQYEFEGIGLLGLKVLKRFAEDSQNEFAETLREHDDADPARRIPLATVSNLVLGLLLSHLAAPDTANQPLSPYLFRFSDCHALAVQFYQKMWEESRAGVRDLDRITRMTRSQIAHVLNQQRDKSWFRVRQEFLNEDFAHVRDRQLRELATDHALLATPKAQALKARLYAEAYERVSRQKVAALEAGAWFRLAAGSTPPVVGGQRQSHTTESALALWRFYRLLPDHRTLSWFDATEPGQTKLEATASLLSVSVDSIVDVTTTGDSDASRLPADPAGPDQASSSLGSVRRRFSALQTSTRSRPLFDRAHSLAAPAGLSFSVSFAHEAPVHLVAADSATCATWVDGLSILKPGGAIVTMETLQYIDSLADMGTRIKLLDLQDRPAPGLHGSVGGEPTGLVEAAS